MFYSSGTSIKVHPEEKLMGPLPFRCGHMILWFDLVFPCIELWNVCKRVVGSQSLILYFLFFFPISINVTVPKSTRTFFFLSHFPYENALYLGAVRVTVSFFFHTIISNIQRLAAGEWFTARVSSCGLFHTAYPSAPETLKTELRTTYSQLCQDDMPMVRRSAATNLGKFAATVEAAHLKADILSIFEDLTQDGMCW